MTAAPASVPADGLSAALLTVSVLLPNGTPIVGAQVELVSSVGRLEHSTATSDEDGIATTSLTSTVAGVSIVRAVVSTNEFRISLPQEVTVTFSPITVVAPTSPPPSPVAVSFDVAANTLTVDANQPLSLTISARDANLHVVPNYLGEVSFSSSDPMALLPDPVIFLQGDGGVHSVSDAFFLRTMGTQSITATDLTQHIIGMVQDIAVSPVAASQLIVTAMPSGLVTCSPSMAALDVIVTDPYGNLVSAANPNIQLSLQKNPRGAVLSGATTAQVHAGHGAFSGIQLDSAVNNYRFVVSDAAGSLAPAVSPIFNVTDAPPQLHGLNPPDTSSTCIVFTYAAQQACGARADIEVSFDAEGKGNFIPATQAPTTTNGVNRVPTSAAAGGRALTYGWNSSADIARMDGAVTLRFQAIVNGVAGDPITQTATTQNGLSFTPAQTAATPAAPNGLAWADFNSDGIPDVIATAATGLVFIASGNGMGDLASGPAMAAGAMADAPTGRRYQSRWQGRCSGYQPKREHAQYILEHGLGYPVGSIDGRLRH